MTAISFIQSKHGPNVEFLSLIAIAQIMDEFVEHKHDEWKAKKDHFNAERWQAAHNIEEIRKRLPKKDNNQNY